MASDDQDVGPPFHDFTSYTLHMLFPTETELQQRLRRYHNYVCI